MQVLSASSGGLQLTLLPPYCLSLLLCAVQVFLEETSLVARPAVDFPDLKERLEARMKWLGIKVGRNHLGGRWDSLCC